MEVGSFIFLHVHMSANVRPKNKNKELKTTFVSAHVLHSQRKIMKNPKVNLNVTKTITVLYRHKSETVQCFNRVQSWWRDIHAARCTRNFRKLFAKWVKVKTQLFFRLYEWVKYQVSCPFFSGYSYSWYCTIWLDTFDQSTEPIKDHTSTGWTACATRTVCLLLLLLLLLMMMKKIMRTRFKNR